MASNLVAKYIAEMTKAEPKKATEKAEKTINKVEGGRAVDLNAMTLQNIKDPRVATETKHLTAFWKPYNPTIHTEEGRRGSYLISW